MTTAPVMSITDELVAELEYEISRDDGTRICITDSEMRLLLAERAELKWDAERLDWLCSQAEAYGYEELHGYVWSVDGPFLTVRAAIDAAMQAAQ